MVQDESGSEPDHVSLRLPYATPAIDWEQPFEAQAGLASACGKMAGTGEPCDSSPAS